jgi:Ethanolamine utilization protein EutJ (predicted chaperonin)
MTLTEFEAQIFAVALDSPVCEVPAVRRLTPTSIGLRVDVKSGGFIDVFYNDQTGTTAFALTKNGKRVFGADNTGGWHIIHPFSDPTRHDPLPGPISFAELAAELQH